MNYQKLSNLPAEAYLNPANFKSDFDIYMKDSSYALEQYLKGLEIGDEYDEIHINIKSVWSGCSADKRRTVNSYEGIGYHTATSHLLSGFLNSTAKIIVHRVDENRQLTHTVIKESTKRVPVAA